MNNSHLLTLLYEPLENSIQWNLFDRDPEKQDEKIIALLHEACLVESFLPVYIGKVMELFWDDLFATDIYTIESYEAFRHFHVLRKYLDMEGNFPVRDQEIIELRKKEQQRSYMNPEMELVNFLGTELFAARFFRDILEMTQEPLLKSLLPEFIAEETLHSEMAYRILERRIASGTASANTVLGVAKKFQHVGEYVYPKVHPAKDDNLDTILLFNRKIEQLTGKSLSSYLHSQNDHNKR